MADGVLLMSGSEGERAFLVGQSVEGRLGQREASERLGISVRQFKRLVRAWRCGGDAGLVLRQRGRPSHRRMSEAVRTRIDGLLKERYSDFGATLAAEKLLERDGIKVSAETVRRIQIDLGCGDRRPGGRAGCFRCANGGPGLASWCRSMAARTIGSKAGDRAAR
jgi:transposase